MAVKILSTDLRRITHSSLLNIINNINVMLEYKFIIKRNWYAIKIKLPQ